VGEGRGGVDIDPRGGGCRPCQCPFDNAALPYVIEVRRWGGGFTCSMWVEMWVEMCACAGL
jgi:hypothetical protein